ncbi:hypothetical protein E3P91_04147 [Wallemia ichthyophaga]|nr:hypothetical protein E3P91_04147 [Wallemia ichthyophaga]
MVALLGGQPLRERGQNFRLCHKKAPKLRTTLFSIDQLQVHGPISLIQIDSHIDTWSSGKKYGFSDKHDTAPVSHGNMLWHASEENLLTSRSIQAGIRTRFTKERDITNNKEFGIKMITIDAIDEIGAKGIADQIRKRVGNTAAYLTIDIDSVDPAFAGATGTPEPGGLTTREAKTILRNLKGLNFVGADIVEVIHHMTLEVS